MTDVAVIYHENFHDYNFGSKHPLKPFRWKLAFELLRALGMLDHEAFTSVEPLKAEEEDLLCFHRADYLEHIRQASKVGSGFLNGGDTPSFKGCYDAACLAVGGSLRAADMVMRGESRHAINLGGGYHHAHPAQASGFCIFNDVAITVAYLLKHYQVKRILYLDIDAHHGDGVMQGFYHNPALLDIDLHEDGRYLFPHSGYVFETGINEGEGYKVNLPLPPFTGDEGYLRAFQEIVPPLAWAYRPEVILFQCGVDGHFRDPLTHLSLTSAAYRQIASTISSLAEELCEGRLVMFAGGGYDTVTTVKCWALMLGEIAAVKLPVEVPPSWLELCRVLMCPAPSGFYDDQTDTQLKIDFTVELKINRVLNEVKRFIFPQFGLG